MEVYTSLPDKQIKTSFAKTERTDMARFRNGHLHALRRWQHLVGISKDDICRLSGEEVESVEHIWLRRSALLVEQHHSDLIHSMHKLVSLPNADLALMTMILWRLQWHQQQHHHMSLICCSKRRNYHTTLILARVITHSFCFFCLDKYAKRRQACSISVIIYISLEETFA